MFSLKCDYLRVRKVTTSRHVLIQDGFTRPSSCHCSFYSVYHTHLRTHAHTHTHTHTHTHALTHARTRTYNHWKLPLVARRKTRTRIAKPCENTSNWQSRREATFATLIVSAALLQLDSIIKPCTSWLVFCAAITVCLHHHYHRLVLLHRLRSCRLFSCWPRILSIDLAANK